MPPTLGFNSGTLNGPVFIACTLRFSYMVSSLKSRVIDWEKIKSLKGVFMTSNFMSIYMVLGGCLFKNNVNYTYYFNLFLFNYQYFFSVLPIKVRSWLGPWGEVTAERVLAFRRNKLPLNCLRPGLPLVPSTFGQVYLSTCLTDYYLMMDSARLSQ